MIKIGDFSKLAHVTVKTLHHYGELGLLSPAYIDRYTGYRYYRLAQLPRLNRILALKDLGFSLEQIAHLVAEELSIEEMRGMLKMKQLELAKRVDAEQARLSQVEVRLREIESAGQLPKYEIALKDIPSMLVLSTKMTSTKKNAFLASRHRLQDLLSSSLERARMKADGPCFALMPELPSAQNKQRIELAVSVKLRAGQRAGDWAGTPVQLKELKSVPNMASTFYDGEDVALSSAYANLFAWLKRNAYEITGPYREVYLSNTGNAAESSGELSELVEVQCPVERAAIPVSVLSNQFNQEDMIMQPKFVNKPAFTTVGLSYVGKNENNEIPQLWGSFNQQADGIKNMIGKCAYGACFSDIKFGEDGDFEYMACYEVSDTNNIPEGMVVREIPAYRYAVFTHHGKLDNLQETYKYIYETWLPQSELELVSPHFDMELYDDRFLFDSDKSEFDIYVAIQE